MKKPLINMNKRMLPVLFVLGILVGTTHAWYQANSNANIAASMARIEPAAAETKTSSVRSNVKIGGAFTLINQDGDTVTEQSFADSYKLVFFGFTNCPEICPVELQKMTLALENMGPLADRIQPIFITTDPERDTPEVMKEYVALYHPNLVGLTGTVEQINEVKETYRVYAAKQEIPGQDGYQMNHSSYIYLMSPDNELVTMFWKQHGPDMLTSELIKILEQS